MQSDTLRFFRLAKNLPQKTLADALNMSPPNYSDLENGKTRLSNKNAVKNKLCMPWNALLHPNPITILT